MEDWQRPEALQICNRFATKRFQTGTKGPMIHLHCRNTHRKDAKVMQLAMAGAACPFQAAIKGAIASWHFLWDPCVEQSEQRCFHKSNESNDRLALAE